MSVHPSATVDPDARIDPSAEIGPYCVVGPGVSIGPHTLLKSHVVLQGPLTIGAHNSFFPQSVIGEIPQDLKFKGEKSSVVIGDYNTFRECVTVNRGTEGGGMVTRIGNHNLLMAYVHIAHDCTVEDYCTVANGVNLAGHVTVQSRAVLGGMVAVTQFNRIGSYAYIAAGSMIRKDILPYMIGKGTEFRLQGVNLVGLRRAQFESSVIQDIKTMYRILVIKDHTFEEAKREMLTLDAEKPHVAKMIQFCETTKNGLYRNRED